MYRKEIISYIFSICLIFLACILHFLDFYNFITFPIHTIVFILYTFVIFLWMRNMSNRVLRSHVSSRFKLIGILLIMYLTVRTVKYEILIENEAAVRFIRYLYFVFPMILTQLVFLTSLYVGKSERENISKFWKLLWIPTIIASIIILTNDYHGLVFSLDLSARGLNQYGIVYYLVIIYIGLMALLTLAFTMVYSFKNRHLISVKIPVLIIFIWGLYTFLYMLGWETFDYFKIIFKSAEFNILMVILFIESLVFMRLLPSNRGYESFLHLSSLNIGIMDLNGNMIFTPTKYENIDPYLIKKALNSPILIDEDTLLESANIKGGRSFYFIDLSDFNKLKRKLIVMSEDMLNENELLKAKNSLKKNMIKVEEQREIREHIQLKLRPQLVQLKYILTNLPEDEDLFEKKLKHACFIGVYIKRYSNLFLITKNKNTLDLAELKLAFCESLDYLKLSNVSSNIEWTMNGSYDSKFCLNLYEIFQNTLEFYMPDIDSLNLNLYRKNNLPVLNIKIKSAIDKSFLKEFGESYAKDEISIREEIVDGEINLCIYLESRQL